MQDIQKLKRAIFKIDSKNFESLTLRIFKFQAAENSVYRKFLSYLNVNPLKIQSIKSIPFLPIQLFKKHRVLTTTKSPPLYFESSGTSGSIPSKHYVADPEMYHLSLLRTFEKFYGHTENWTFLALLPSYLERKNASLPYMVQQLMNKSGHVDNGFYLNNLDGLAKKLQSLERSEQKTMLIGVSFALLELAKKFPMPLLHTTIMETGGMKGRGKELVREDLHYRLQKAFNVQGIHSEYGMTELLSQAYSRQNGIFSPPPWMKVQICAANDPLENLSPGQSGTINIIDLANIHSCSFIATQDIGRMKNDGSFEVLGRMDTSDVRGCNLLAL